jgi:hypothetical protein
MNESSMANQANQPAGGSPAPNGKLLALITKVLPAQKPLPLVLGDRGVRRPFHSLATQGPHAAWTAIDRTARKSRFDYPPLRVVRMSGRARAAAIKPHLFEVVRVRLYDAAKTVADCFRLRNKLALDVTLEALGDFWSSRGRSADEPWRSAKFCSVANVMRPHPEMLSV